MSDRFVLSFAYNVYIYIPMKVFPQGCSSDILQRTKHYTKSTRTIQNIFIQFLPKHSNVVENKY